MDSGKSAVIKWIFGLAIVLAILVGIFRDSVTSLMVYVVMLFVAYFIYKDPQQSSEALGLGSKNIQRSALWAVLLGGGFYFVTKLIPGASIGLPLLPNTISEQFRFIIIVALAPLVETIFFQGALFAYIKRMSPSKKNLYIAITIQAVLFSMAHLAAYIVGFYSYPNILSGILGFSQNISAFISAFLFAWLAGFFVSMDGIKNLWFVVIFHALLNLIIYTNLVIVGMNLLIMGLGL